MKIESSDYLLTRFADSARPLLRQLAWIEPTLCGYDLSEISIEQPVFITGLARSGTTILLELLSTFDGAAAHRYRDFPFVMIPLLWNSYLNFATTEQKPVVRAHQDRILITRESPEAFEEPIWKSFFPDCHQIGGRQVLTSAERNQTFDRFFQEHLKKILLLRQGKRYISKGNYNVIRVEYLAELFPDARFIVPIRHPLTHIDSLVRQHQLFSGYAQADPRVSRYLEAAGHYEFGPQRRPIEVTPGMGKRIQAAWSAGDDWLGYALQWSEIYGYVDRLRSQSPELAERVYVIRYEDFCDDPQSNMNRILSHICVPIDQASRVLAQLDKISPSAHVPTLSEAAATSVLQAVREVASRFGYDVEAKLP